MVTAATAEAEKIVAKVRLLLGAGLFDSRKDAFAVQQLCAETLALLRSQLRSEGIKVDQIFDPDLPRIYCSFGMARLVCLEVVLWLCAALFSTTTDRRLEIRAEQRWRNGKLLVHVSLLTTAAGVLLVDPEKETLGRESENAVYSWRCLALLKDYLRREGGELLLATSDGGTSVSVDFPAEQPGERDTAL